MKLTRYSLSLFIAIALLCLAILPYVAWADDSSLGAIGLGVVPLQNDQVVMVAERVEAEIHGNHHWVTCIFTFRNAGPATEVLMGFPQAQSMRRGNAPELRDFRAFVDGEEVPVEFRPSGRPEGERDYAGWHTFTVPFAAGQTRTVRNTYHGRLTLISNGYRSFGYVLHTGATWKGPIGQADIVLRWRNYHDVDPETLIVFAPEYTQGRRELRWHFTDLEPTPDNDISVDFRPFYGPHNLGRYGRPSGPFCDGDPTTAWQSVGETAGARLSWGSGRTSLHPIPTTLGLGILPGVAGSEETFRAHGRPKEIRVRLARLEKDAGGPPEVNSHEGLFDNPVPEVEITEHHLTLEDAPRWQFLQLEEPATVLGFQVVMVSVYPGERYDDVAIAEVLFPLLEEHLASPPAFLPTTGGEMPTILEQSKQRAPSLQSTAWLAGAVGIMLLIAGFLGRWIAVRPNSR